MSGHEAATLEVMTSTGIESTTIEQRAALFSALSDPIRLGILDRLAGGRRCVCDLQKAIAIAPNLLSYHLRVLRETGLVISVRRGRWVDYELADDVGDLIAAASPFAP